MAVRGESRQLLLELSGVAPGTFRLLVSDENSFKLVATLGAKVFKNWHVHSPNDWPHSRVAVACIIIDADST